MVSSPAPDLDARALGRVGGSGAALEADQLDLVRLVLQLVERVGVGGHPAREPLALLDDLAHRGLDLDQVLGHERGLDVEVVVEAVLDRRADAEPGLAGTAPARPAPSRARSSGAGCRGRRRWRCRRPRPRRRPASTWARSRSSPPTRAAMTSASSSNSSQALVPVVVSLLLTLAGVDADDLDVGHGMLLDRVGRTRRCYRPQARDLTPVYGGHRSTDTGVPKFSLVRPSR